MGRGGKYVAGGLPVVDHPVDGVGDVELFLEFVDVLFEETLEDLLAEVEIVWGESPHVHRAEGLAVEFDVDVAGDGVVAVHLPVVLAGDVEVLLYGGEPAGLVIVADAPGNASAFGKGVVEFEADDAVTAFAAFVGAAPVTKYLE